MPEPKQPQQTTELDDLAFQIYTARIANHPTGRGGEYYALDSYRKAEAFIAVRDKVKSGALQPKRVEGPKLSEASAPNLHKYHPINLVSQRYGDLQKVSRIVNFMQQHKPSPNIEDPDKELLFRLKREFPELDAWDENAISTARLVLHHYAPKQ